MKLLLLLLLLTISHFANAQDKIITGVVSDETDMPIPGVQVIIEGSRKVVETDFDGKYSIEAKPGQKLAFSFPIMKLQTVTVDTLTTVDIF